MFDVLENEVNTLIKEIKPSGYYEVKFEGSNLPSGIYYYQLEAGSFNQVRKMMLTKWVLGIEYWVLRRFTIDVITYCSLLIAIAITAGLGISFPKFGHLLVGFSSVREFSPGC